MVSVRSADRYDIFAIEIVATILGYLYGPSQLLFSLFRDASDVHKTIAPDQGPGSCNVSFSGRQLIPNTQELGIKIAAPCGMLFGQLIFGWLGDVLGRKRTCEYKIWFL